MEAQLRLFCVKANFFSADIWKKSDKSSASLVCSVSTEEGAANRALQLTTSERFSQLAIEAKSIIWMNSTADFEFPFNCVVGVPIGIASGYMFGLVLFSLARIPETQHNRNALSSFALELAETICNNPNSIKPSPSPSSFQIEAETELGVTVEKFRSEASHIFNDPPPHSSTSGVSFDHGSSFVQGLPTKTEEPAGAGITVMSAPSMLTTVDRPLPTDSGLKLTMSDSKELVELLVPDGLNTQSASLVLGPTTLEPCSTWPSGNANSSNLHFRGSQPHVMPPYTHQTLNYTGASSSNPAYAAALRRASFIPSPSSTSFQDTGENPIKAPSLIQLLEDPNLAQLNTDSFTNSYSLGSMQSLVLASRFGQNQSTSNLREETQIKNKNEESCSTELATKRRRYTQRMCKVEGCEKYAQGGTPHCMRHGGGRRCKYPKCEKMARNHHFCSAHGGGIRCVVEGCNRMAVGRVRRCTAHGGGVRCAEPGCPKAAQGPTKHCVRHGGGYRCTFDGCDKAARGNTKFCVRHKKSQSAGTASIP
eukprot:CAMPEP_0113936192 /NCGR_PEP_ID=MMETSP1339-20121228/3158_1 /TAXON_ID=94617 /ORGANISM="Fibrocapsa japonica" /LENGTH=534 /DNA_ID=CAMNT_0000938577 /DNA_START=15 /DNA_END=1619 /DNA_ORIENTATION=- /assembly_acc=CAM_ASM_000762